MSPEVRSFVDLDDATLSTVRFGRNRILRTLDVALFGGAVHAFVPERAYASHCGAHDDGCVYCKCSCGCCGSTPCSGGCANCQGCDGCCPGSGNCWYECIGNGLYRVCDWNCDVGYSPCCCSVLIATC